MPRSALLLSVILLVALPLAAQQKDDKNCQDHPLFTRMPNYWIHNCRYYEFNAYEFQTAPGSKTPVEGQMWQINYLPQATLKTRPSELQIHRNFENAVAKLGGKVVWNNKGKQTFRIEKEGQEYWVEVSTSFTSSYVLTIIQHKAMSQSIDVNAAALAEGLHTTGHIAVYGILFDTGKWDLKPESDRALVEIAKLMKAEAGLSLYVVGHTDNVGQLADNMKLSQNRAEAVVKALVHTHGIAATRLKSFGNGPYAPVSANETEEGRAKNRRVELVAQ